VQTFPGNVLKSLAGISDVPPMFQTTEAARVAPDAAKYL
jgi:hypothetical protein